MSGLGWQAQRWPDRNQQCHQHIEEWKPGNDESVCVCCEWVRARSRANQQVIER